jgi:hypothetical protein
MELCANHMNMEDGFVPSSESVEGPLSLGWVTSSQSFSGPLSAHLSCRLSPVLPPPMWMLHGAHQA